MDDDGCDRMGGEEMKGRMGESRLQLIELLGQLVIECN